MGSYAVGLYSCRDLLQVVVYNLFKHKYVLHLKQDPDDYSPEKYFDYDETTHRYVPNVDIAEEQQRADIQYMIDEILRLNHGVVINQRRSFIESVKFKIKHGEAYEIDRFFTAVNFCFKD